MKKILSIGLTFILALSASTSPAVSWKPWALASCVTALAFAGAQYAIETKVAKEKEEQKQITDSVDQLTQEKESLEKEKNDIETLRQFFIPDAPNQPRRIQQNKSSVVEDYLEQHLRLMSWEFTESLLSREIISLVSSNCKSTKETEDFVKTERKKGNKRIIALKEPTQGELYNAYNFTKVFTSAQDLNTTLLPRVESRLKLRIQDLAEVDKSLEQESEKYDEISERLQSLKNSYKRYYWPAAGASLLAIAGALWASFKK